MKLWAFSGYMGLCQSLEGGFTIRALHTHLGALFLSLCYISSPFTCALSRFRCEIPLYVHFTPIYVHFSSLYVTLLLPLREPYHDLGADFPFTFTKLPFYVHFPSPYVTLSPPLRADSVLHPTFTLHKSLFNHKKRADTYTASALPTIITPL